MAANAIDLTLAATVAADLGVASSATVERVVTAASRAIATYCGRVFEKATAAVEYPQGYGTKFIILQRAPIVSITSVYVGGTLVSSADYSITAAYNGGSVGNAGMIYKIAGVWPSTQWFAGGITDTPSINVGTSADIAVTYVGGYATPGQVLLSVGTYPTVTLPEDIQEAAILTAVALYRSRGVDSMVQAEALGDWSVSYFGAKAEGGSLIPNTARALLDPYVFVRAS